MKKLIFGLAMIIAATASLPSFAAGDNNNEKQKCENVCNNDTCSRKDKKRCKKERECYQQNCNTQQNCNANENCYQQNCNSKEKCVKSKKDCKKDGRQAYGKDGRRHGRKHMNAARKDLFAGITLTEAQQQKITELRAKAKADRKAVKAEMKKDKEKSREKMAKVRKEARKAHDKAVREILTPEQYARYKDNLKAANKDAKEMRKRRL